MNFEIQIKDTKLSPWSETEVYLERHFCWSFPYLHIKKIYCSIKINLVRFKTAQWEVDMDTAGKKEINMSSTFKRIDNSNMDRCYGELWI